MKKKVQRKGNGFLDKVVFAWLPIGLALVILSLLVWFAASIFLPDKAPPFYGQERVFWGIVLMAAGVVCIPLTVIVWYKMHDELQSELRRDYGFRCMTPTLPVPEVSPDPEAQIEDDA